MQEQENMNNSFKQEKQVELVINIHNFVGHCSEKLAISYI